MADDITKAYYKQGDEKGIAVMNDKESWKEEIYSLCAFGKCDACGKIINTIDSLLQSQRDHLKAEVEKLKKTSNSSDFGTTRREGYNVAIDSVLVLLEDKK